MRPNGPSVASAPGREPGTEWLFSFRNHHYCPRRRAGASAFCAEGLCFYLGIHKPPLPMLEPSHCGLAFASRFLSCAARGEMPVFCGQRSSGTDWDLKSPGSARGCRGLRQASGSSSVKWPRKINQSCRLVVGDQMRFEWDRDIQAMRISTPQSDARGPAGSPGFGHIDLGSNPDFPSYLPCDLCLTCLYVSEQCGLSDRANSGETRTLHE